MLLRKSWLLMVLPGWARTSPTACSLNSLGSGSLARTTVCERPDYAISYFYTGEKSRYLILHFHYCTFRGIWQGVRPLLDHRLLPAYREGHRRQSSLRGPQPRRIDCGSLTDLSSLAPEECRAHVLFQAATPFSFKTGVSNLCQIHELRFLSCYSVSACWRTFWSLTPLSIKH